MSEQQTQTKVTRWRTGGSTGPDEAAKAIGIYNEHGFLVADVVPAERQRVEPPEDRPKSFSLKRGGEEKVELMAAAPTLRRTVERNQDNVKTARAMLLDGQNVADMDTMRTIMGNAIELLDEADERADDVLEGLA